MNDAVRARILVIDDDPAVLRLVQGALETGGYQLRLAADPLQAFAKDRPQDFDLIITDYEMKALQEDALTFIYQRARDQDPSLQGLPPLIVITGHHRDACLSKWGEWPALRGVVEKPFDLRELRDAVAAALSTAGR